MSIFIGTASWTDKTLIACGRFYPPRGCSTPEARLRFYASQFPMVEVDSSYYAMPAPNTAQSWAERTPNAFTFNVKAFRLFTGHQTSPIVLHRDLQVALGPMNPSAKLYYHKTPGEIRDELWRRFREALAPLVNAGKLGLVHFQFPPWLLANREGHDHVRHCVEQMSGFNLSVEFRHRSWWSGDDRIASTLAFERELGVVHTVVDGPQGFDNSVPALWEATHDEFALLRLHGRNTATWDIKGATAASDRFNYDYPDNELQPIAREIEKLASKVAKMQVVFNNNQEDQGQRNARALTAMVAGATRPATASDPLRDPPRGETPDAGLATLL